jgi:hypothetical protein
MKFKILYVMYVEKKTLQQTRTPNKFEEML